MKIRPVLDAIRPRPKQVVPCAVHRFRDGWEFCLDCGLYKREIPRAKGGYLE